MKGTPTPTRWSWTVEPSHSVTITVNDPSNTDVTADPADLTFTPVNWDTAQTVTVTVAQDNGHDDEDGTVTHTAASTDTKYSWNIHRQRIGECDRR